MPLDLHGWNFRQARGANTVADHIRVLSEAITQIPDAYRAKIWIRVDGAGATHDLVEHMKSLNTTRRTVRFTVGWKITDIDEAAIAKLPPAPGRPLSARTAGCTRTLTSPN
ncbi:hypothetical protein [Nonomuraea sp. B19D2]|uniref:hypothetical protein n=1 Tax=Nonomuraea sp. B19D2 TaxID=3159561 RepID=UPI0032DB32B6